MLITTLTERERKRFRLACQPLYDRYGAGYEEMLEQIQAAGEQ